MKQLYYLMPTGRRGHACDRVIHRTSEVIALDRMNALTLEPNTWLPFGGGVRRCIGAGFSLMEGAVVLREVLSRYRLALPDGSEPERGRVRNITNVPRRRARVVVAAR